MWIFSAYLTISVRFIQGCIKFLTPPPGRGTFIKYLGEEYQVAKGGGEGILRLLGQYYVKKREKGVNIILPMILRLLGRISSGKEGMGD